MKMLSAASNCFRNYLNFSDRCSRSELWWFYLFTILVHTGAAVADGRLDERPFAVADGRLDERPFFDFPVLLIIHALRGLGAASLTSYEPAFSLTCSLILFPAMLSAGGRRMRDIGKSPLLYVIPVGLSVSVFSYWWWEIGQHGYLVYAFGDDWQIYLTYTILPFQIGISLFCALFLLKRASPR